MLLRSTAQNERIYVEQCDLSSIDSIKCFIQKWQKDAKSGMVQDLEARIDGIIFCDGDGAGDEGLGYGTRMRKSKQVGIDETMETRHATHLTGRHALVQLLLPTLLRSASTATSPIRIINQVSAFYAAIVPRTFNLDLEYTARPFPSRSPELVEGQVALASIILWKEFQSRLELTSSSSSTKKDSTSTPSAPPSDALPTSSPILALSVCPGLTRSYARQYLRASTSHSNFSPIGLAIYLVLLPFIWLFAKSASEGAQVVLGALMADTVAEGERGKKKKKRVKDPKGVIIVDEEEEAKKGERRMWVKGGGLYREGLEVRYLTFSHTCLSPADPLRDQIADIGSSACNDGERIVGSGIEASRTITGCIDEGGEGREGCDREADERRRGADRGFNERERRLEVVWRVSRFSLRLHCIHSHFTMPSD